MACPLPDGLQQVARPLPPRSEANDGASRRRWTWGQVERAIALMLLAVIAALVFVVPWGRHPTLVRREVVVRPGDTLIGIIERTYPGANPYPILYRVEHETHGAVIWPGERLVLP